MQRYLVEFFGTVILSFTYGAAVVHGSTPAGDAGGALAVGLVYLAVIYAGGHVSGGHYNPAVTLGLLLRGRGEPRDLPAYLISQLLGAFVGGVAASATVDAPTVVGATMHPGPVVLAEFLFTFALVYVVLHTATARANSGNSFYGLAAGGVVVAGIIAVGRVSFGSFNPALSVTLAVSGTIGWLELWMHFVPQLAGAAAAAYSFRAVCKDAL